GDYHFLLDEYLKIPSGQLASLDLQESLTELAAGKPFGQVSQTLEKLTAGRLSVSTIYNLLQKTVKNALTKEREDWQAVYEKGEIVTGEERQVRHLFTEGDGVFVHLQREKRRHYEVKQALGYEGWERLSGKEERYKLVGKRVYCQGDEEIPFWEGVGVEWSRVWDFSILEKIILGGDGAKWIDGGLGEFSQTIRQLDGFHLSRACGRGWENAKALYQAIRSGQTETARQLIQNLTPREKAGSQKARQYVRNNLERGQDWRTQLQVEGKEARGMGTMESNEDKLVANRMKKKGLSWTIKGALRMNKALQLTANGEIRMFCGRQSPVKTVSARKPVVVSKARVKSHQKWLDAGLPALEGPHANRPWANILRNLAYQPFPLN
ncbi:MAG: UPF0236 family protein, partial [Dehalococcoidales bacterium]|nr:UPF0236 family protein [Dehalococcoidales bacterium]